MIRGVGVNKRRRKYHRSIEGIQLSEKLLTVQFSRYSE